MKKTMHFAFIAISITSFILLALIGTALCDAAKTDTVPNFKCTGDELFLQHSGEANEAYNAFMYGFKTDEIDGTLSSGVILSFSSSQTYSGVTIQDMSTSNYIAIKGDSGGIVFGMSGCTFYPCGIQGAITSATNGYDTNGNQYVYGPGAYSKAGNIENELGNAYVR